MFCIYEIIQYPSLIHIKGSSIEFYNQSYKKRGIKSQLPLYHSLGEHISSIILSRFMYRNKLRVQSLRYVYVMCNITHMDVISSFPFFIQSKKKFFLKRSTHIVAQLDHTVQMFIYCAVGQ